METKKCKACLEIKPLTEFYKSSKQYYQARCKPCNVQQVKVYRDENPIAKTKYSRAYRTRHRNTPKLKVGQILEGMQARSKRKGFSPPTITKEEILTAIQGACAKTGIPFEFDQSEYSKSPWTPVPDRIDSSKGYTADNVQWVCHMYNSMKQEYGEEEIERFLRALWERHRF